MGRDASKSAGNPYFEARLDASNRIDRQFSSREGASALIGISADSLAKYESNVCKTVPPESVLAMAKGYGAPELINWYCSTQCPIGRQTVCPVVPKSLEQVTLRMIHLLSDVDAMQMALVEITYDGFIGGEELAIMEQILGYFDRVAQVIAELKIWCAKNISAGLRRVG